MNHKFKPGDKVRCIDPSNTVPALEHAKVYTVRKLKGKSSIYLQEFFGNEYGWFTADRFELVEEKGVGPEKGDYLDTLIQRANDGMRAITALYNADPTVVAIHDDGDTRGVTVGYYSYSNFKEFRRKAPAPLPAPFVLNDSKHKVSFEDGHTISVGCQTFNQHDLMVGLQYLVKGNQTSYSSIQNLYATKSGVKHASGQISWADAEQLLEALEKIK